MKRIIFLSIFFSLLPLSQAQAQKSEAVYNKLSESYTLNADGSSVYNQRKELTLNTIRSFDSMYGETFIVYDPQWQSVQINEAYTIQADGSKTMTPPNAFNEVLPSYAADAPDHNRLKELVVTHTGTEIGAKIVLDYTVRTKAGYPAAGEFLRVMDDRSPVSEYSVSYASPSEPYYEQTVAADVRPVRNGNKLTFTFRNIAELYPEPNVAMSEVPYVYFSAKPEEERVAKIMDMISSVASDKANLKGVASPDEYISKEIALKDIPFSVVPALRPLSRVQMTAYATRAERAALRIALDGGEPVLAFEKGRPASILTLKDVLTDKDEADAWTYSIWSLEGGKPSKAAAPSKPVSLSSSRKFTVSSENASRAGDYLMFSLPAPESGVDTWGIASLNYMRVEPYLVPSAVEEVDVYDVSFPGLKDVTEPFSKEVSNSVGAVSIKSEVLEGGAGVRVTRFITIRKQVVPASEYGAFRSLMNAWNDPALRTLILK